MHTNLRSVNKSNIILAGTKLIEICTLNFVDSQEKYLEPVFKFNLSLTTGVCGGEVGGVKSDDFLMWRRPVGGERSTGEEDKSAGVDLLIISAILVVQRLLLLCVRKMRTTPLRGPLGEYSLRARTSTSAEGGGTSEKIKSARSAYSLLNINH